MDAKDIIAVIAILLTFAGYVPYVIDILKNKTRPHIFSWLIWSISTGIIYLLQRADGAGAGSWITLALTIIVFCVFLLSLRNGTRDIRTIDVVSLVAAIACIYIWLGIKQPLISMIVLCAIDVIGFIPTLRKSWNDPYSETLSLYTITTFRHGLSLLALERYTFTTSLFAVVWIVVNGVFSIILIVRRKQLRKKSKPASQKRSRR